MEGAAWMHWGAVETRETGLETFTYGGGGEHISTPHGLEDHSDGKVAGHPSETEVKLEPPQIKEEQQERSPSLVQVKLEPPQIKEEQEEELLQRPEGADALTLHTVIYGSDYVLRVEHAGRSQPTSDDQLLSSHCSERDTEDGDERETCEQRSALNALKSHKTQRVEGQRLSLNNELSQDMRSSKQMPSTSQAFVVQSVAFFHEYHLKTHMSTHTAEKSFACPVCSKMFTRRSDLNRHVRTHTGEKPFACAVCYASFNLKHNLKSHMSIHTHACTACSKTFIRCDKRHIRQCRGSSIVKVSKILPKHSESDPFWEIQNGRRK